MTWVLFVIVLESDRYYVSPNGMFRSMNECFEARDLFLLTAPQPKIDYEAVCVKTDKIEMQ